MPSTSMRCIPIVVGTLSWHQHHHARWRRPNTHAHIGLAYTNHHRHRNRHYHHHNIYHRCTTITTTIVTTTTRYVVTTGGEDRCILQWTNTVTDHEETKPWVPDDQDSEEEETYYTREKVRGLKSFHQTTHLLTRPLKSSFVTSMTLANPVNITTSIIINLPPGGVRGRSVCLSYTQFHQRLWR